MKRLIIAAVLLALIIALAIVGNVCVTGASKELNQKIDSVVDAPTEEKVKDLKAFWDKKSKVLSIFVNREGLESVGEHTAKLYAAYYNEDMEELLMAANEIKYIIGRVTANEKFSFHSVF